MRSIGSLLLLAMVFFACRAEDAVQEAKKAPEPRPSIGSIERIDPGVDGIVPVEAKLEVLADGHDFTEGPVWVPALEALLYTDIPRNAVYKWNESEGASLWLQPSGYTDDVPRRGGVGANGLALDGKGGLLLAQHGDRRLVRLDADLKSPKSKFETLASHFEGKRLNSPNDIAPHSRGDIYFTDPPYGLAKGEKDPAKELDFQGVYRVKGDGSVELLVDDLSRPNGVAFSPDEKTLYVANSGRPRVIMSYPVNADGTLGEGKVFYPSSGDGMAVDSQGNVYVAGPQKGVIIVSPEGKLLGLLKTEQQTTNCTFGEDGSTLFITADMYLLRVRLKSKGRGF